jgi:hypothetical protein
VPNGGHAASSWCVPSSPIHVVLSLAPKGVFVLSSFVASPEVLDMIEVLFPV